ncbi:uncharacterized protein BDZ83DRAFT_619470 [Colletotrichum acutatum]|uniref:Uncharacterized protein n=1 Tax=Glomerella acutata TaxID=27357 RepID=A0AAD8XGP0_GLOAC|nr:uncharacterized protein BDZ83DRAFT_619470 [Colletotrichum acutatum]KAK1725611.1 hypothetical protein BDZ83DRAFT_619470 [Colletotrichum acutatum]
MPDSAVSKSVPAQHSNGQSRFQSPTSGLVCCGLGDQQPAFPQRPGLPAASRQLASFSQLFHPVLSNPFPSPSLSLSRLSMHLVFWKSGHWQAEWAILARSVWISAPDFLLSISSLSADPSPRLSIHMYPSDQPHYSVRKAIERRSHGKPQCGQCLYRLVVGSVISTFLALTVQMPET